MKHRFLVTAASLLIIVAAAPAEKAEAAEENLCRAYGSVCETGFDCCSEICETFTDDKFRCGGDQQET